VNDASEIISVDLTEDELRFLIEGLRQWGGPGHCTDAMATGMGFDGADDLLRQASRIETALLERADLSRWDWTRALLVSEIDFASDVIGAGYEWSTATGLDDAHSLLVLRGLQRKLGPVRIAIES
jgi:hypothetical protein